MNSSGGNLSSITLDTSGIIVPESAKPKEMLSISEAGGVTSVSINFSSLTLIQQCARKAQYSLIRGLRPALESPALTFGSAIHKGLEVYYSGERTERRIPSDYKEIMSMIGCGQWQEEWGESLLFAAARAFALKAEPLSALPDDNKRSIFTGVWMLQHYFQKYLTDEYVIMRDEHGPVVERKFTMPIHKDDGLEIDLFGTIDFVMKSEVSGQILPGDHKTASSLYDFYDKVSPNFQYTGYLWAAREILGYDTDLFLVNALQVKQPPKTARGSEPDFARQITQRTEEDFNELRLAIVSSVRNFLSYQKANHFPMSASGQCTASYGRCDYQDVCAAPSSLRENIISAKFNQTGHQA